MHTTRQTGPAPQHSIPGLFHYQKSKIGHCHWICQLDTQGYVYLSHLERVQIQISNQIRDQICSRVHVRDEIALVLVITCAKQLVMEMDL